MNYYWNASWKHLIIIRHWLIIMLSIFLMGNIIKRLMPLIHGCFSIRWAPPCLTPVLLSHSTSSTLSSLPFLDKCKYVPASGSLYLLLPMLRNLPHFLQSLLKYYHIILNPPRNVHCSFLALLVLVCIILISTQLLNSYRYLFISLLVACIIQEESLCPLN